MKRFWMFLCLLVLTALVSCNYKYTKAYFLPEYLPPNKLAGEADPDLMWDDSRLSENAGEFAGYLCARSYWDVVENGTADSLYWVRLRFVRKTSDTASVKQPVLLTPSVDSIIVLTVEGDPLMVLKDVSACSPRAADIGYSFRQPYFSPELKYVRFQFVVELNDESGAAVGRKSYDVVLQRYDHRRNDVWGLLLAD